MSLSIAEKEQVLQSVHDTLLALTYDAATGIPEIRETLAKHGLTLNIQVETSVESSTVAGDTSDLTVPASPPNVDGGLQEWQNMGIRMDDLREVAEFEARKIEEREKALFHEVRTVAESLSSRGRNYSWGWLNLHYPEIGLDDNPVTIRDERFALLSDSQYWQGILETALTAIKTRTDKFEVLSKLLTTLKFAKKHT